METEPSHRPLCTIELIAGNHAERCPGEACPYWEDDCVLARVEAELRGRSDIAELLLAVRHALGVAQRQTAEDAHALFHRRLSAGCE